MVVLFAVFTVVGMFAFNYGVSLPKLADDRWGDERQFGWVLAVTSDRQLPGSLLTAAHRRVGDALVLRCGTGDLGVSGFGVAWAPNIWVASVLGVPLGAGGAAFVAAMNGISQQESPPDMRGRIDGAAGRRVPGLDTDRWPVTGWVADDVSAEWCLAYGSVISLVCVGDWAPLPGGVQSPGDVPAGEHRSSPRRWSSTATVAVSL